MKKIDAMITGVWDWYSLVTLCPKMSHARKVTVSGDTWRDCILDMTADSQIACMLIWLSCTWNRCHFLSFSIFNWNDTTLNKTTDNTTSHLPMCTSANKVWKGLIWILANFRSAVIEVHVARGNILTFYSCGKQQSISGGTKTLNLMVDKLQQHKTTLGFTSVSQEQKSEVIMDKDPPEVNS